MFTMVRAHYGQLISHFYQLDASSSVLRVARLYFSLLLNNLLANSGEPDSVASDLALHCLPMSHKKNAIFIWSKHAKARRFEHR